MMIKKVQKRVLDALANSAVHRTRDVLSDTGCSSGELLELASGGFVSISDAIGDKVCITRAGLNEVTAFPTYRW